MNKERNTSNSATEVIPSKELRILYSWQAPIRPFQRKGKEFWKTIFLIDVLVGIILVLAGQYMLFAVIISLTFLYYVLSTVEPEQAEYRITNNGVMYSNEIYPWEIIRQFWFSGKDAQRLVNFELTAGLIGRICIVVGNGNEEKMKEIISKYLIEEAVKPTFFDKASNWLQEKVPLESMKEKTLDYSKRSSK